MLNIPYVKNPNKACALSCYTMTAKYFFPETTWDDTTKIVDWVPGKVVWGFKFWIWIMDKGIKVTDYDLINYKAWAEDGLEGLRASVSEKEFQFYLNSSTDLNSYTEDIKKVLEHKNFTHHRQKPSFNDLEKAFIHGGICEVTLDSCTLDQKEGFFLHRVVILDITDDTIIFHDPRKIPRPARKESRKLFEKAWLEVVEEPELCIYEKS